MSARILDQFQYSYEKGVVTVFASVVIGAAGAVTSTKGGGIESVTKEATAGQYSIKLKDPYYRFLGFFGSAVDDGSSGVAAIQILEDPATLQADFLGDRTFKIQCYDYAGAAVNPANGAALMIEINVRNTVVGPWDN